MKKKKIKSSYPIWKTNMTSKLRKSNKMDPLAHILHRPEPEIWIEIKNYENRYLISTHGRVFMSQYIMEGKLITTFSSAADACKELGICSSGIIKVCKGKRNKAGGSDGNTLMFK